MFSSREVFPGESNTVPDWNTEGNQHKPGNKWMNPQAKSSSMGLEECHCDSLAVGLSNPAADMSLLVSLEIEGTSLSFNIQAHE